MTDRELARRLLLCKDNVLHWNREQSRAEVLSDERGKSQATETQAAWKAWERDLRAQLRAQRQEVGV